MLENCASGDFLSQNFGLASRGLICKASEKQDRFPERLSSGIPDLDHFFDGGLPFAAITECGMPLGLGGRFVLLHFLANGTRHVSPPLWVLWVSSYQELEIFPPAWMAKDVSLEQVVFAYSKKPMQDLKRAILHHLFKVIVFDAPPHMDKDDFTFLCQRARENNQIIVVLRDFFLTNKQGNVWASLRFNCAKNPSTNEYVLTSLKGLQRKWFLFKDVYRSEHSERFGIM